MKGKKREKERNYDDSFINEKGHKTIDQENLKTMF